MKKCRSAWVVMSQKQTGQFRDAVPVLCLVGGAAGVGLDVYRYAQRCELRYHELHLQLPAVLVPAVTHLSVLGFRTVQDHCGAVEVDVVVVDLEPLLDALP